MSDGRLGAALRELSSRGFADAGYRSGYRLFKGNLSSPKGQLKILLGIKDWDFLDYPEIYVIGGLEKFPQLRPHLDKSGGLCYFAPRSVILDRYDPATAIAQSLQQAEAVLAQILSNAAYRFTDVQNEFLVHWAREEPAALEVYMGAAAKGTKAGAIHFLQTGKTFAIITDQPDSAQVLASVIGLGPLKPSENRCWLFWTKRLPPVPAHFPRTLSELFEWMKTWDEAMYHEFQRFLARDEAYGFELLPVAVHSPVGWIGFMFSVVVAGAKKAVEFKQRLHEHGKSIEVQRMAITDISPEFVHSRNLAFRDLSGKRISLVGCGAIGSHLGAALVRLGAGAGGGLLRMVDFEALGPENLGRHYLGYDKLGEPKAKALRAELLRQFPLAKIEAVDKDVVDVSTLFACDLVIDATGEEALSEYLNGAWLERASPIPVLYVWIKGNGECVQCLWVDRQEFACLRCLRESDPQAHRKERFPVLKTPPNRRVLGCHAFTPYAVSAPLEATALAIDVISDWLKGNPGPRFRTRQRENADLHPVVNHNPTRLDGCPACAPT